jgi:hypothetical protein
LCFRTDVSAARDATIGAVHGVAVEPDRVLTVAPPKRGLRQLEAPFELADVSDPAGVCDRPGIDRTSHFRGSCGAKLWTGN